MFLMTDINYYPYYNYRPLLTIILIANFLWVIICMVAAGMKGRSCLGWGFLGFVFGLFAVIAVSIASDISEKDNSYFCSANTGYTARLYPTIIAQSKSPNKALVLEIERLAYYSPEVRILLTVYIASSEETIFEKDLLLETNHDLEKSDITDIRWFEDKIEVDILYKRTKPPVTHSFEF